MTTTYLHGYAPEEQARLGRMNDLLMEIISRNNRSRTKELSAQEKDLFYLACYDLDRFRDSAAQPACGNPLRKRRAEAPPATGG